MPETEDMELLGQYANEDSDEAFATLVKRHVNLVYSVALRHVRNPEQAGEITQAVFILLARKSKNLSAQTILSGWLYHAARLTAANFVRHETRRIHREQEVYMQSALNEESSEVNWPELSPILDEAMDNLGKTDRDALVLRYFDNKSLKEVGKALGMEERTAQKRVSRGVEKLRKFLGRRRVVLSAAALATAVSANSVQAAPTGLVISICATAAKGSAAAASTMTLVNGVLKIMAWTKAKTAIVAGVAILLAAGTTTVVVKSVQAALRPDIQGTWMTTVDLGGWGVEKGQSPRTRLVLKITKNDDRYLAAGDMIDLGNRVTNIVNFKYGGSTIHGEIPEAGYVFDGTLDEDGKSISGKLKIKGTPDIRLTFKRSANPPPFPEPLAEGEFAPRADLKLQGYWDGNIQNINRGQPPVHINIKIAEAADGTFRADLYCPNPKDGTRQPTDVTYDGETVKIMPMAGYGMFEGTLSSNGQELAGQWTQGGIPMPTKLTRAEYRP